MAVGCRFSRGAIGLSAALLVSVVAPREARADTKRGPELSAALEVASLVLPTAGLLDANKAVTTGADVAMPVGFHFLYRQGRLALGVTASLALFALTSSAYSGTPELPRTHERGYFQLAPELRVFVHDSGPFEVSVGGKAGLVMVADRYANVSSLRVPSNYGVKTVSVRSEGVVAMAAVGGAWRFGRIFSLGLDLRAGALAVPVGAACLPGGDCPTMNGLYPAFELGVAFAVIRGL